MSDGSSVHGHRHGAKQQLCAAVITVSDTRTMADELAELAGTISYEILLSISERVPRVYTKD